MCLVGDITDLCMVEMMFLAYKVSIMLTMSVYFAHIIS